VEVDERGAVAHCKRKEGKEGEKKGGKQGRKEGSREG